MSQPNLSLFLAAAVVLIAPVSAIAKATTIAHEPCTEGSLTFDSASQKILDKKGYLQRVAALRLKLEHIISSKASRAEDVYDAKIGLLTIDPLCRDFAKNDPIALQLERSDYGSSKLVLIDYYRQSKNDTALTRLLARRAAEAKASPYPSTACSTLQEIGDTYFKLHKPAQAEKYYKEAVAIALKAAVPPKPIPGYVVGVTPGRALSVGNADVGPFEKYAYFLALQNRLKEAAHYADIALDYWLPPGANGLTSGDGGSGFYVLFLNLIKGKDAKIYEHFAGRYQQLAESLVFAGLLGADGKELTAPNYEFISKFSEGLAAARDRKTWRVGYIDNKGVWKIPPRFLACDPFAGGLAPVKLPGGGKPYEIDGRDVEYALIDRTGKVVAKIPFPSITGFDGVVAFCSRQGGGIFSAPTHIVDKTGEVLFGALNSQPVALGNEQFYLPIQTGQKIEGCCVTPLGYVLKFAVVTDSARPGHFKIVQEKIPGTADGATKPDADLLESKILASTRKPDPPYDRIGNDDKLGLYVKGPLGARISSYYSNMSAMENGDFLVFGHNMKQGVVDAGGKEIVKPAYQMLRPFCDGRAAVSNNQLWGFVDRAGREITPTKYNEVTDFAGGVAIYARRE